ncbi:MAG: nucleotidyltransferase family protein [Gammaproteobacteria bacterium]|nr:nucleotidyltransferase family protein [Gammaproteobacteria bacterium]
MKAMILAAGRGERLRPITDSLPKPLVQVRGKPLIQHHIEALVAAGITDLVINHAWLGEQIEQALGTGQQWGAQIQYSPEGSRALDTGGGIYNALPLLGSAPFLVINGDIFTDYSYASLLRQPQKLAHLVLVSNPQQHPQGDFALQNGEVRQNAAQKLTYSGMGVYRPAFFQHCQQGAFPLAPLLVEAMERRQVTGEYFGGHWDDIGTVARLQKVNKNQ